MRVAGSGSVVVEKEWCGVGEAEGLSRNLQESGKIRRKRWRNKKRVCGADTKSKEQKELEGMFLRSRFRKKRL